MCTQEVLRKNHRLLVNSLDLSASKVLDKLHEEDVLSSGEQEDILSRSTTRDQNSRLLFLLKRRDIAALEVFVGALKSDYSFIVDILSATPNSGRLVQEEHVCVYCLLSKKLIPNDVTHYLYEEEVISDDDLEELNNGNVNRVERVSRLLKLLKEHPNRKSVETKFLAALKAKYQYILDSEQPITVDNLLSCRCDSESGHSIAKSCCSSENYGNESPLGSIIDINRNSSVVKRVLRKVCEDHNSAEDISSQRTKKTVYTAKQVESDLNLGCDSVLNDTFSRKSILDEVDASDILFQNNSILNLAHAECCDNFNDVSRFDGNPRCSIKELVDDPEDEYTHLKLLKESPKVHCYQQKTKPKKKKQESLNTKEEERCASSVNTSREPDNSAGNLVCHVRKVLPNNSKLMKMCKKLWDQLFYLREKGDWGTFSQVTSKAFDKFADNPDIQVLLYRSEMCVSTFYKSNDQKAQNMYEKALDLVPQTSMPAWHLARLIPLKVALCTQAKKFEEASTLLAEAHQAMTMLAPCLSTGAVFFFEALYLSAVLRCCRSGSKSAASLVEKVKTCFLTAISHYQHEPYFAIESFLNQVYLFLALFVLGVDCKNIRYIGLQTVSGDNVSLAEHYLSLYENSYWDKSTTWSRMLFFIGRGEQHKLRKSLSRSIDYLRDAEDCAIIGGYEQHLGFIRENIQLVSDRLAEQMKLEELQSKSADAILNSILESSTDSGSGEN